MTKGAHHSNSIERMPIIMIRPKIVEYPRYMQSWVLVLIHSHNVNLVAKTAAAAFLGYVLQPAHELKFSPLYASSFEF